MHNKCTFFEYFDRLMKLDIQNLHYVLPYVSFNHFNSLQGMLYLWA